MTVVWTLLCLSLATSAMKPYDEICQHKRDPGFCRAWINRGAGVTQHTAANQSAFAIVFGRYHEIPKKRESRESYLSRLSEHPPSFLVYIQMFPMTQNLSTNPYKKIKADKFHRCSGALITSQYVLSAGHCFCSPPHEQKTTPCKKNALGQMELLYRPKDHVVAWVGLNDDELRLRYEMNYYFVDTRYRVIEIKLHPKYENELQHYDVALAKLQKPTCIGQKQVPIAMPRRGSVEEKLVNDGDLPKRRVFVFAKKQHNGNFEVVKSREHSMLLKEVHVAGYGISNEKRVCRTTGGRAPLQECKFPFRVTYPQTVKKRWNKNTYCSLSTKIYKECAPLPEVPLPDLEQEPCRKAEKAWKNGQVAVGAEHRFSYGTHTLNNYVRVPFSPGSDRPELVGKFPLLYQVHDGKNFCTAECLAETSLEEEETSHGFCATCDPDAKNGDSNYCGDDAASNDHDEVDTTNKRRGRNNNRQKLYKKVAIAEPGKNWGYCSNHCHEIVNNSESGDVTTAYKGMGLMSMLDDDECSRMLGDRNINTEMQFCGANVINDQRKRFFFDNRDQLRRMLPIKSWQDLIKYGGLFTGSVCSGDSGGPVFMPRVLQKNDPDLDPENIDWLELLTKADFNITDVDGRDPQEIMDNFISDPILVGISIRTIGCGLINKPPIFFKVWKVMDWIEENTKDSGKSHRNCSQELDLFPEGLEAKFEIVRGLHELPSSLLKKPVFGRIHRNFTIDNASIMNLNSNFTMLLKGQLNSEDSKGANLLDLLQNLPNQTSNAVKGNTV